MKMKRTMVTAMLCMLLLAIIPLTASAAVSSNTAQGQGDLIVTGSVANYHGGDLILKEITSGRTVYSAYYSAPPGNTVVVESLNGTFSNLPYGTYQLTWTGNLGGSFSIHF
ncbi:hypothetical protein [Paenibacillus sp. FJAT-26967]|uniref:hypothetical protein n=1 Tax=Paenibacillus sp. FJAT-26967 TaxID=1729690 RepID=UPI000837D652|nr:hypothetical protein [Paenibacillus sp. FJAT-26967]